MNYKKKLHLLPHFFLCLLLLSWAGWALLFRTPPVPSKTSPLLFFAAENDDSLEQILLLQLARAQKSIYLSLYSFNDPKFLALLNQKIATGIPLEIIHDPLANKTIRTLPSTVVHKEQKISGIFHEKILLVDNERGCIGSANFTKESLLLDHNVILAFHSQALCEALKKREKASVMIDKTRILYFPLPESSDEALDALIEAIDHTHESVDAALFTFTHPKILNALKIASSRDVAVRLFSDKKMLHGASRKAASELIQTPISIASLGMNGSTFHHKLALLDKKILVMGSANWTNAAFEKNGECLLILFDLPESELKKVRALFRKVSCIGEKVTEEFFE